MPTRSKATASACYPRVGASVEGDAQMVSAFTSPGSGRAVDQATSLAQYLRFLNLAQQVATLKFPMLSGGLHFRLRVETIGIETIDADNCIPIKVPAGETITVLSGPRPDDTRMVDVQWGDKKLVMFYGDIQKRGERVKGEPA